MKNASSLLLILGLAGFFILPSCGGSGTQKEAEAQETPAAGKTVSPIDLFENDYAKVVKVSLAPGEALKEHKAGARLIYSLSDYTIDWVEQGQDQGAKTWEEGAVHVHEAGSHSAVNSGDSPAEWLAFIRKTEALPECGDHTLEDDVNAFSNDFAKMRFDNDDFRVTEVSLAPSENIPMHSGVNRVIYSLSDYTIRYRSDQKDATEKTFRAGEAHWHDACEHAVENIGETEARFLVVAYKKH